MILPFPWLAGVSVMGKINVRSETGKLYFDFRYRGKRCREQTALDDTPANRRKMRKMLDQIEAEITLDQFNYTRYFPNSPRAKEMDSLKAGNEASDTDTPLFETFAATWLEEMKIQWRRSHYENVEMTLNKHILPFFRGREIGQITKADILQFRATLNDAPGRKQKRLSPSRINHILTPLRMMLHEAANRYEFSSPYHGIKPLKQPKSDVQPFSLEEVRLLLDNVRADYRDYLITRFFTGLRSSEIHGLQWHYVDFTQRQVLVHQALVDGELIYTKNDGSFRAVDMSQAVYEALQRQYKATGDYSYVFCNNQGNPLNTNNVTNRVWYPLLRYLELRPRRPYQTRHTAATLWLAAGENPEWIARQMGHTSTEMLFRVYSRYVPNLTRKDGSAFERLLQQQALTDGESA